MSNTLITKTWEEIFQMRANLVRIAGSGIKDELTLCAGDLGEHLEKKSKAYQKQVDRDSRPFYATNKADDTYISDDKGNAKIMASKAQEHSEMILKLLEKEIEISTFKVTRPLAKRILALPVDLHKLYNGVLWDLDLKKLYSQDNEKDDPAATGEKATADTNEPAQN